jgi:hypothetical protein
MSALSHDPTALLDALDPEALRDRLHALEREARALRVLLRAALARQRHQARQLPEAEEATRGH